LPVCSERYNETMQAAPEPAVPTGPRRDAPGDLELVRQFINTADLAPGEDELVDLAALRAWLLERRLIGPRDELAADDLGRALAVREALRSVLESRSRGAVDDDALRSLNLVPAGALLRIAFDGDGMPRLEPVASGLDGAIAELYAIIRCAALDGTWERLKVCADHGCLWAFYDHSKNRSRSWCNMAVCGNRAKARHYRERKRPAGAREGATA
jgi:predicted RNA-binding Zn ribbon-like protein